MRLLLDENLPKRLKFDLLPRDVFHVSDMKWNGIKNGELLRLMLENNFDALLTMDKNLAFQQNFQKYPIPVLGINSYRNSYHKIQPFAAIILQILSDLWASNLCLTDWILT